MGHPNIAGILLDIAGFTVLGYCIYCMREHYRKEVR